MLAALFVKQQFSLRREIITQLPVERVFNHVRRLTNQDRYSKWVMSDPAMKKEFRGEDGAVVFVYAWDGNKQAGKGEQELAKDLELGLQNLKNNLERKEPVIA